MCGIVGFYNASLSEEVRSEVVRAMSSRIAHRGPDDSGVYVHESGLTLGHRRLSILDLSPLGHQPMVSPRTGNVIVFNGELYNFHDVRGELESLGYGFTSTGDTEVLLAGIDEWGLEETLKRCNGMFAIAVWHEKERRLQLARDRAGEKPLYYGWLKSGLVFSSELKALYKLEEFSLPLSPEGMSLFFEHGYITHPFTIFQQMWKLVPGTVLTLPEPALQRCPDDFSPFAGDKHLSPTPFWSIPLSVPPILDQSKGIDQLHSLLQDAVRLRMISDVPVGGFLSGGIDSSLIVALMQECSTSRVKSFSIGFDDPKFDEAPFAKAVANHLGTDHTELYVPGSEALRIVPELSEVYDEPFADSSQIPTLLLARLTKEHVTVALSGDGGDELFRGYTRYPLAIHIWNSLKFCPAFLRKSIAASIHLLSMRQWNEIHSFTQNIGLERLFPRSFRGMHHVGLKAYRLAEVLSATSLRELYVTANTHWRPEYFPCAYENTIRTVLSDRTLEGRFTSPYDYLTFLDLQTYLPEDILHKVDRATMSSALEARVPLLDHRVIEFSRSLPENFSVRGGISKWILREVLKRYVPEKLFDRPKTGFGVPLPEWLRGELKEWGENLLSPQLLPENALLKRGVILEKWDAHQRREIDFHYPLWNVLQFQAWFERWKSAVRQ